MNDLSKNKMSHNQLGNFLSSETKNILAKYKRLCELTIEMGVPSDKTTDLVWLSDNLPKSYTGHRHYPESINLVNKLIIIKK